MNDISLRLLEAVKNSNYSYGELSKLTGIPKSAIQRYATGETEKIPLDRLQILAPILGTTAEHILGWDVADPVLKKQHEEINELFDRLPPAIRTAYLTILREAAQAQQAPDDPKGAG